ncbi:MAG: acetylxylan esterase [Planctomycetes bacterium]|nr:acetylxylan esterase [Planctomycetota bacterium]
MLGLDPLPKRTDLKATITGRAEHDEFIVENLHFQSRPGLYVTANLYLPKKIDKPLPAILYVCGHGRVKKDGVSYGNKVHYQHHGAWFARNGYACLTIDTLQLGEIEGIHHGTYNYKMWWWINRGYTPAGVEAWNCLRALDYLQSRKEVDPDRIGVTGRSGGGAYSWWIASIDERIKVAVPVAGITDLQNHVVAGMPGRFHDGCVEGHCDCMYMLNTFRWDYAQVAAMVAPRALLISNSDKDGIFPLDGVLRLHGEVRDIYRLYEREDHLGLQITEGPHRDTQELRVHAFRWFNRFLKNDDSLINTTATKFFEPEDLKVFKELPDDQKNTEIHESFVAVAPAPSVPKAKDDWKKLRDRWRNELNEKVFRGWPSQNEPLQAKQAFSVDRHGVHFEAVDFTSQNSIRLRLYLAHREGLDKPDLTVLNVLDNESWLEFLATMRAGFAEELKEETLPEADEESFKQTQAMFKSFKWAMAYIAPRGIGPTAWDQSPKKQTQHRRRFYLLGQTLDGMRIWDVRRAIQTLRTTKSGKDSSLWLQSHRQMAGVTTYASLFEPEITRLDLYELPKTHRDGPILFNVRRIFDMPQAVAMAAENSRVVVYQSDEEGWKFPKGVLESLGWDKKQLQIRKPPSPQDN